MEPGDARRVARFGGAVLAGMVHSETDLVRIMGWKSPQMLRRYGA